MKVCRASIRLGFSLAVTLFAAHAAAQQPVDPDGESRDFGIAATTELRLGAHATPTPATLPGARTIRTVELQALLGKPAPERPLLFDVLGGTGHDSIPGAVWLADAGRGTSFEDDIQQRLAQALQLLSAGDTKREMVFFCANTSCWLSYNVALRAMRLGYTSVSWYRGGIAAWLAAGGEVSPMRVAWRRPAL